MYLAKLYIYMKFILQKYGEEWVDDGQVIEDLRLQCNLFASTTLYHLLTLDRGEDKL